MKIKSLLVGMFACAALVACTNNDLVEDGGDNVNSDSKAYVAVNIVTTGTGSRTLGDFEDGTGNESKVNKARFYFFDNAGVAFSVNENRNYIDKSISNEDFQDGTGPIEKAATMLVINGGKGVPSRIIAILNPDYASLGTESKNLDDLRKASFNYDSTEENSFVMSNSVYANGNEIMDAVTLAPENICTSVAAAEKAPVNIYVERILAKVTAESKSEINNNTFDTGVIVDNTQIYAQITGYQVTTTKPTSYLIKNISIWTNDELGFDWNDNTNHRSYWATSTDGSVVNSQSWNETSTNGLSAVYCQENTSADKTKMLFAAKLQDDKGQAIEIAEYFGVRYAGGEDAVKAVMLGQLTDYWYSTGANAYSQLVAKDLTFMTATADEGKSYEVKAHLASGDYTFYTKNGDVYTLVEKKVVEAKIAELKTAMIYKAGMTYYYIDIEHSGADGIGKFGIVRNHSYKLTVNSIAGLGTPVYDPNIDIVPIIPSEQNTYIAATVHVLAWKIVSQGVDLGK